MSVHVSLLKSIQNVFTGKRMAWLWVVVIGASQAGCAHVPQGGTYGHGGYDVLPQVTVSAGYGSGYGYSTYVTPSPLVVRSVPIYVPAPIYRPAQVWPAYRARPWGHEGHGGHESRGEGLGGGAGHRGWR